MVGYCGSVVVFMRTGHIPKRMNSKFDRDKNEYDETNFIYIAGNYAFKYSFLL